MSQKEKKTKNRMGLDPVGSSMAGGTEGFQEGTGCVEGEGIPSAFLQRWAGRKKGVSFKMFVVQAPMHGG